LRRETRVSERKQREKRKEHSYALIGLEKRQAEENAPGRRSADHERRSIRAKNKEESIPAERHASENTIRKKMKKVSLVRIKTFDIYQERLTHASTKQKLGKKNRLTRTITRLKEHP